MTPQIELRDLRRAAIHRAGHLVVAAVKESQHTTRSSSKSHLVADGATISVAGTVAELLADDPDVKDWRIRDHLYCDYLFTSVSEMQLKGIDLDNLLRPIQEAMRILVEYGWLHRIVTRRLLEHGQIQASEIQALLQGGSGDSPDQPRESLLPLLVTTLIALIVGKF